MAASDELLARVDRALDEAVHVRRRSNFLVKMLGSLKDELQEQVESPEEADDNERAGHIT